MPLEREKLKIDLYAVPQRKRLFFILSFSALAAFLVGAAVFSVPTIGVLEWGPADLWARKAHGKTVSRDVAVVGITDAFLDEQSWPLEKDIYGDLIDYLSEMGAEVIAFDLLFADNLDDCGKGDSIFREMVGLTPNIVMSYALAGAEGRIGGRLSKIPVRFSTQKGSTGGIRSSGVVLPYPELLEKTNHLGFINKSNPLADGIDRKMPLFVIQDSLAFPSLSLVAASMFGGAASDSFMIGKKGLHRGKRIIPLDRDGYLCVNFSRRIPVYDIAQVRDSHRQWLLGNIPPVGRSCFEGRIVFIGNIARSLGDFGITPLSVDEPGGESPNILMHARSAATLLEGQAIRPYGRLFALFISAAFVLVFAVFFFSMPAPAAIAAALVIIGAALFASNRLYNAGHFIPLLEGFFSGSIFCFLGSLSVYFEKEIKRKYLYSVFGRYLSPKLIEEMYKKEVKPSLGGEEVDATAFFSDIENFSSFSEELEPAALIENLNEYFERMTRILLECNGVLDKYIGDAIVAFFGAPCTSQVHACDACLAAVRMQEALARLRLEWERNEKIHDKVKKIKMRIGINTGRFVTGNIGCNIRMNYTMIGDTVNLASRLESAAKEYGVYTVVGQETCDSVWRIAGSEKFLFRRLDSIKVKGRTQPVSIFQLMGERKENDGDLDVLIKKYESALNLYMAGDFTKAAEHFDASIKLERYSDEKNPSLVMRERCRRLACGIRDSWDGVYEMPNK